MNPNNLPTSELSHQEICLLYLKKYEEKDLDSIEGMFAEDIVLRDWKIRVEGKENAISETHKNFHNADTIAIEVLAMYENKHTVASFVVGSLALLYQIIWEWMRFVFEYREILNCDGRYGSSQRRITLYINC